MNEFENKSIRGIYISRYLASWANSGGNLARGNRFKDWLQSLVINGEKLSEEEISEIVFLSTNGKLELEMSAKYFLSK